MDVVTYALARAYADRLSSGEPAEMRRHEDWIEWRRVGELEWHQLVPLVDIAGPQGLQGIQGEKGEKGDTGAGLSVLGSFDEPEDLPSSNNEVGDAYLISQHLWVWDGDEWVDTGTIQGPKGETGKSAYQEAVDLGFQGDVSEWLASLKGEKGDSLEFQWDGTTLKIRSEGDTTWDSADLRGEQGPEAPMPPRLAEQAIPAHADTTVDSGWHTEGTPVSSTFTRASHAWDGSGLVAPDTMRVFGRDTKSPVVLIEGQRTNLLSRSGDGSALVKWAQGGDVTITPDAGVAPDGTMSAARIVYAGGGESPIKAYRAAGASGAGVSYTSSIWVRADSPQSISLSDNLTGSIRADITSEWKRFILKPSTGNGTSSVQVQIRTLEELSGVPFDIYVWGLQIEEAPFASSYIPTDGAPATRAQDNFTLNDPITIEDGLTVNFGLYYPEMLPGAVAARVDLLFDGGEFYCRAEYASAGNRRVRFGIPATHQFVSGSLTPGYMVITYTILDGTALLYVNGQYRDEVPAPPNGTIIDTVSMSPAQSVMAPGAAALGIPFIDNRAWSAEEIQAAHARWLPELEKIEVPV